MNSRRAALLPALCLLAALAAPAARAATRTWTGAGSSIWSDTTNWVEGVAPASGDDLVFPAAAVSYVSSNDIVGLAPNSLTFSSTSYGIAGNAIAIGAGGVHATATITIPLAADLPAVRPFVVDAGQTLTWQGVLSGVGGLTKSGPGRLILGNANTFTGAASAADGFLANDFPDSFGATSAGTSISAGASLQVTDLNAEPLSVAGTGVPGYGAFLCSSTATLAGPVALPADATAYVGGALTLNGDVSGPGVLTLTGGGNLVLNGNAPGYTAGIVIGFGGVLVNGDFSAAPVSFGSAPVMFLGGSGTVGAVTGAGNPHTIAPGPVGGAGILTTGNLLLGGNTTLAVDLLGPTAGTQYDQLAVQGTVTITNAPLSVNLGFAPSVGQQFAILHNDGVDPIAGTFLGLNEGDTLLANGVTLSISYVGGTGNDVVLTVTSLTPVELQRFDAE